MGLLSLRCRTYWRSLGLGLLALPRSLTLWTHASQFFLKDLFLLLDFLKLCPWILLRLTRWLLNLRRCNRPRTLLIAAEGSWMLTFGMQRLTCRGLRRSPRALL